MSTNIEFKNTVNHQRSNSLPIRVVLAESILAEISLIKTSLINISHVVITTVHTYEELLSSIVKDQPELVLLGSIDIVNYFEIYRECQKIRPALPIVLLSKQPITNDSFRQAVQSYGVTDIVCSNDLIRLSEIFSEFQVKDQANYNSSLQPVITGQMILTGLNEIITVSNNFFGPLAQGNYWRKSHTSLVDEYPFLQNWTANHFSQIDYNQNIPDQELTKEDIQCLQQWVHLFVQECERIIVNFREILVTSDLSAVAQNLLTNSP